MEKSQLKVHAKWIETIQDEGKNLTPWEMTFLESIADRIEEGRELTDKQAEVLERIYAEKTP